MCCQSSAVWIPNTHQEKKIGALSYDWPERAHVEPIEPAASRFPLNVQNIYQRTGIRE